MTAQQEQLFSAPALPRGGPRYRLQCADAVAFLGALPDESIDLVITDPAYESLEKHRRVGTTTRLTKDWFPIFPNCRYGGLFRELFRVLRPDSHCYVMCDQETMFVIKPVAEACGFKFWKPLVWDKQKMGMGYHYRASYEFVLFFEKGKRKLNNLGVKDILSFPRVAGGQFVDDWRNERAKRGKAYPTEKPVELLEVLIRQSSEEGSIVVDPFAGSGSTGEAALRNARMFVGCDVAPSAVELADCRLKGVL